MKKQWIPDFDLRPARDWSLQQPYNWHVKSPDQTIIANELRRREALFMAAAWNAHRRTLEEAAVLSAVKEKAAKQ